MKTHVFILFIFTALGANHLSAQSYSGSATAVAFVGELNEYYRSGFGVIGQYELDFTDKIIGVGQAGFIYIPNDFELGILIFTIPLQVGAKYMLNDKLYAQGMIGIHRVNAVAVFGTGSGSYFSGGLGVGAHLRKFEAAAYLNLVAQGWSCVGLRAGYRFEQ